MTARIGTLGELLETVARAPLAGPQLDGTPCHACREPIRGGDRIALLGGGVLHVRGGPAPEDYAVVHIAHEACAESDPNRATTLVNNIHEE